jgi:hypothetical protein
VARRHRSLFVLARVLAGVLVVVAAAALSGMTLARSSAAAASAAYYAYCPDGSSPAVSYGYCPPPPNLPPTCAPVVASPTTLKPRDHKLQPITLSGATDPDDDAVALTITAVTQDEPLNGTGDGDVAPDAQSGTLANTVFLRAERSGTGDGRVYRVSFAVSDGNGGTCTGIINVFVPKDTGSTAIDSAPPSYDSFGP